MVTGQSAGHHVRLYEYNKYVDNLLDNKYKICLIQINDFRISYLCIIYYYLYK